MRILALTIALAACSDDATSSTASAGPTLDPVAFFTGRSEGHATLHKLVGKPESVHVVSSGRSDGHGGVLLDQRVEEQGQPARMRSWHLVPSGPGRLTGTLTDASGPVAATFSGPRLDIRYPMKGGLRAAQVLALRSDGRTVDNRLSVTKFGVRVAHLEEVIVKAR